MSGPVHEQLGRGAKQSADHSDTAMLDSTEGVTLDSKPFSIHAFSKIGEILKGHGPMKHLPELFSVLRDEQKAEFREHRLDDLAMAPGETALECAQLIGANAGQAVHVALCGRPPATTAQLRTFLARQTGQSLATIVGDDFMRMKSTLGGALIDVIPCSVTGIREFSEHSGFLRWFVETTAPAVCAHVMSTVVSVPMARTLNREHLWSWVDHLRPVDVTAQLISIIDVVQDAQTRDKLTAFVGPRAGANRSAYEAAHAGDLREALARKQTMRELLEAIGRAGRVDEQDAEALIAAVQRLHASADDVLAIVTRAPIVRERGLRLLLNAPGVTAHHVVTMLNETSTSLELLKDRKVRADVRRCARGLRVQDLLPAGEADGLHETIVGDAGLTTWFLDEASPKDLLWFCTASPNAAPRATRTVRERFGLGWVHELTSLPDGKDAPLRALALHCSGTPAERYIRQVLLGDVQIEPQAPVRGSRAIDPDTRAGEHERLKAALRGPSEELLARLADLDEGARAQLGRSDDWVRKIGETLAPEQWARAARYLDLTVRRAVAYSPGAAPETVAYLHERPLAEELEVLAQPQLVRDAAAKVHPNLLVVLRSLHEPAHLAAALGRDGQLLELLLAGSDASRVADLIAREPARARALAILEERPELVEQLPRYQHMTAAGRAAIDKLARGAADDGEARLALEDVRRGEVEPDGQAKVRGAQLHGLEAEHRTLAEAIEALAGKHAQAMERLERPSASGAERRAAQRSSEVSALALLEAHRKEVPALLADPARAALVDRLSALVDLPPDAALPWIGRAELLQLPNALRWWMRFRDPAALLQRLAASPAACALVADALGRGERGALAWLGRAPRGAALEAAEEGALDRMRPRVRNPDALRALFEVRFGIPAPAAYDAAALDALYAIVARLPPGHIQQERIKEIAEQDLGTLGAGLYSQGAGVVTIDDDVHPGASTETLHPADMQAWRTAAEMQQVYGFDAAELEAQVQAGRVQAEVAAGVARYRLAEQKIDLFTQVVLHEIGHSVDELLGERTAPVFDFAEWREYDDGGFEAWAAEMGGWERVAPADRAEIRKVWIDAARGKTAVDQLVGPEHPALASRYYPSVGLVKSAVDGQTLSYTERVQHGARVFVAGRFPNTWYSLSARGAQVAPSEQALHAPAEYFAECYVEYYRGVDGTPGSAQRKGGALAAPVKQWFDANVDQIRFDPRRFKGPAQPAQPG